ncbi:MAG: PucR family transcriptional regulator ligand-binding domain-containing protein [Clostridia bacterium]|nr:PucR family transcriptional regulator ligand-binding domain-containing protein [Clostridia bacterium]
MELLRLYEKNKDKFKLNIAAGENGIHNDVARIYYIEDTYISDWTRKGELIMTTGMAYNTEKTILEFIKSFLPYSPSGFIINMGGYIFEIPESVKKLCDKEKLPLLTFPWEIYLQDVMQEFTNMIYEEEQLEKNLCNGFREYLYNNGDKNTFASCLERNGYGAIDKITTGIIRSHTDFKDDEFLFIKNQMKRKNDFIICFKEKDEIVVIYSCMDIDQTELITKEVISEYNKFFNKTCHMGIGSLEDSIYEIKTSLKRAEECLHTAQNKNTSIVLFDNLGIEKLLMTCDKKILKSCYYDKLKKIEDYDIKNKTEYIKTLKSFVKHKGNISEVTEELYVHRNTVNYRVTKLKEMLDTDFNDINIFLEIAIAFLSKEIL